MLKTNRNSLEDVVKVKKTTINEKKCDCSLNVRRREKGGESIKTGGGKGGVIHHWWRGGRVCGGGSNDNFRL